MKAYYTERGVAKRLPMVLSTLQEEIRRKAIVPCAVTVGERPTHLFSVERMPELRAKLLQTPPEVVV